MRMPVVFIPHGGGPWPFVDVGFPPDDVADLAGYLRTVAAVPPERPSALLVVSAHWEEPRVSVMTSPRPPMLYDYYGFPPESYAITWPAPGHPELAAAVQQRLADAKIPAAGDSARGFDHGTFIPLKLTYPDADIPAIQVSLRRGLDPSDHLAIGAALAPFRDDGVFIIASGMTFHNLRLFRDPRSRPASEAFDGWLRETMQREPDDRNDRLVRWAEAPAARVAHPREEHLIPLMVAAGATPDTIATLAYNGTFGGIRLSAFHFA